MTTAAINPERGGAASAGQADAVDDYIRSLGRRLRGPWRARHGMLQEVRDGLDDATRALLEDGHSRSSAQAAAVAEFGPVDDLVTEFQRELAVLQVRRTAAGTAVVLPVLWLAWGLLWSGGAGSMPTNSAVMALATFNDLAGLGTAAVCLGALVTLELVGGRLRTPERLVRMVARATLLGVSVMIAACAAMALLNLQQTAALAQTSAGYCAVSVVSVLAMVTVIRSARRCAKAASVDAAPPTSDRHDLVTLH